MAKNSFTYLLNYLSTCFFIVYPCYDLGNTLYAPDRVEDPRDRKNPQHAACNPIPSTLRVFVPSERHRTRSPACLPTRKNYGRHGDESLTAADGNALNGS